MVTKTKLVNLFGLNLCKVEYFITYIHLYICLSIVCYLVPTFSRGRPITPQVVFVSTRVRFLSL